MKQSLTILGAAVIIAVALYLGLSERVTTPPPPESAPINPSGVVDPCPFCGRDVVQAHGRILVKNTTRHHVTVYVRHHPELPPRVLELDPNAFEVVEDVLVGTMMLRAVGEGFDEESHCTIQANTQHEMWWTTRGWEMHGAPQMHM